MAKKSMNNCLIYKAGILKPLFSNVKKKAWGSYPQAIHNPKDPLGPT